MHKVAICVCTYHRPRMLRECLLSLATLSVPSDIRPIVIIVDNEAEPNNRDVVSEFMESCPFQVSYIHELKRGIAAARNAALKLADALNAAWIAFIDDDARADPDWLAEIMSPEYRSTAVLMGANKYIYPTPTPFWVQEEEPKGEEGQKCKTAYSGNVRFSAARNALPLLTLMPAAGAVMVRAA